MLSVSRIVKSMTVAVIKQHQAITVLGLFLAKQGTKEETPADLREEIRKVEGRIRATFWSILLINWVLVIMGIFAFWMAWNSAAGGNFDVAALLSFLGVGDILSVFTFAMDRVQRNLGDQVQVRAVFDGFLKQMAFVDQFKDKATLDEKDLGNINAEIRDVTKKSMQLLQDFTEIAKPIREKPWITALPIRYSQLRITADESQQGEIIVHEDKNITMSGTLQNVSKESVKINAIVIAVRPPGGTPDGGPFRFDFKIEDFLKTKGEPLIMKHNGTHKIENTKCINDSVTISGLKEEIPDKWIGKDWYAFMTCQTEDGCWHDDHNKKWFEVRRTKPEDVAKPK